MSKDEQTPTPTPSSTSVMRPIVRPPEVVDLCDECGTPTWPFRHRGRRFTYACVCGHRWSCWWGVPLAGPEEWDGSRNVGVRASWDEPGTVAGSAETDDARQEGQSVPRGVGPEVVR